MTDINRMVEVQIWTLQECKSGHFRSANLDIGQECKSGHRGVQIWSPLLSLTFYHQLRTLYLERPSSKAARTLSFFEHRIGQHENHKRGAKADTPEAEANRLSGQPASRLRGGEDGMTLYLGPNSRGGGIDAYRSG